MTFNTMKYWCTVTWEHCTFAIALKCEAHANAHIHTRGKRCEKPLTGSWFPRLLWRLFLELLESGSHWDHCTQRGDRKYKSDRELSQVVRQSLTLLHKDLMWSLKCSKGTSETERSPTKLSSFHTEHYFVKFIELFLFTCLRHQALHLTSVSVRRTREIWLYALSAHLTQVQA